MKLWEKAKEKYPALSRMDFILLSCPKKVGLGDMPDYCGNKTPWPDNCIRCWDREVGT